MSSDYSLLIDKLFAPPLSPLLSSDFARAKYCNELLSNPSSAYPTIHVGGTNGKGSVSMKIANTLSVAGYKVGLYTSPHLYCYRERIQINGEMISEQEVVEGLTFLYALFEKEGWRSHFFELTTFLALLYFKKQQVDVAIIEVGLGGALDTTNVIHPLVSIITSISKDHTAVLGNTIEEIGLQKGGIIKPGVPVVLGNTAKLPLLMSLAKEKNCPLFTVEKTTSFFDEENQNTAELALKILSSSFSLSSSHIEKGLLARPHCRFEVRGDIVLDGAHNPQGVASLLCALKQFFPNRKLRFLTSFSEDKDYPLCLSLISTIATHIHLSSFNHTRAASPSLLAHALNQQGFFAYTLHSSLEEGVRIGIENARKKGEILVICGSFYMMSEIPSL